MSKLQVTIVGQGPDLVLLHGWAFGSSIFNAIVPLLTPHFRVHLMDLPGYGKSPEIKVGTLETLQSLVLAAAPSNATYLGWSMGGLIAMGIAAQHSERVNRLICMASTPKFVANPLWSGVDESYLIRMMDSLHTNYHATLQQFLQWQLPNNDYLHCLNKPEKISLETLSSGLLVLKDTDYRGLLKTINCPQLFLFGRLDRIVPRVTSTLIKTLNPAIKTLIFKQAAHALFLSSPAEFLMQLLSFCHD